MQRSYPLLMLGILLLISLPSVIFAVSVHDDSDQELSVSKPLKRIISLAPNLTDMVIAAGAGDKMIAVDSNSKLPARYASLLRFNTYPILDIEAIYALEPDLVLAWQGGNSPSALRRLQQLGIRVYYSQPETLDNIAKAIDNIGILAGTHVIAKKHAQQFRQQLHDLKQRYQTQKTVKVFLQINQQPLLTVSNKSYLNSLISLCGGRNVFADAYGVAPTVNIESIIKQQPAIIIALSTTNDSKNQQQFWHAWPMIPAVKNHLYFTLTDGLISRPGPKLLAGAKRLCALIAKAR